MRWATINVGRTTGIYEESPATGTGLVYRQADLGVLGDRDLPLTPAGIGAGVVFGAVTRVLLDRRAAVGILGARIALDPAAAEVFLNHTAWRESLTLVE